MKDMVSQFHLYDIVAHIMPGFLAIAILYWFDSTFNLGWGLTQVDLKSADLVSITVFFVGSYVLGTVAQGIGEAVEDPLLRGIWKLFWNPVVNLVYRDNPYFTETLRKNVREQINEQFSLGMPEQVSRDEKEGKQVLEALGLVYSLIVQVNAAERAERMKSILRLFRGAFIVFTVALILAVVVRIFDLVPQFPSLGGLWGALVVLAILDLLSLLLFVVYTVLFPRTAFEDFLAWHDRNGRNNPKAAPAGDNVRIADARRIISAGHTHDRARTKIGTIKRR